MNTKDYRKIVVNKPCHIVLLLEGHVHFKEEGKVVKTNQKPASHLQQLTRSMLCVCVCVCVCVRERTRMDTNQRWTCAELSSETGIVLSTIHKPVDNEGKFHPTTGHKDPEVE